MTVATPPKPKLYAAQARALITAELAYKRAKDAMEAAKRDRAKTRARYAHLFPLGQVVEAAGYRFRRYLTETGVSFRLAAYLKKHKPTKEMLPFIGPSTEYEDWSVTPIKRSDLP